MTNAPTILFLCPHNAAKSVLAVVDCQSEAARRGLNLIVYSAGTEPDSAPAPAVVAALLADGIDVSGHRPRLLTEDDLERAWRIVSMGCDPDPLTPYADKLVRWDEVPPTSQGVAAARAAIRQRLSPLLDEAAIELRGPATEPGAQPPTTA